MGKKGVVALALAFSFAAVPVLAQRPDPRTAAGQLAVSGEGWSRMGYLEFEVKVASAGGTHGPWHYHWDRRNGYLRLTGPGPDGVPVDVAVDVRSRTGGGWRSGAQLEGKALGETVSWALRRFAEDTVWLTFPLEWSAGGVTVTPEPDATGDDGRTYLSTRVESSNGTWRVWLDPESGHVARTVFQRAGSAALTARWQDWQARSGVSFARQRTVAETGETIAIELLRTEPSAPADAF